MSVEGSVPVRITDTPGIEREPDWQPLPQRRLFSGFQAPIDQDLINTAKAGRSIPVNYRLTDTAGLPVSDPAHFVALESDADPVRESGAVDAVETYSGDSGLRYLGDGNWQFNWKTPKSYAGQCRLMTLKLSDRTTSIARFLFK